MTTDINRYGVEFESHGLLASRPDEFSDNEAHADSGREIAAKGVQETCYQRYVTQSTVKSIFGPDRLEAKIPAQTYQDEVIIKLKCVRITHFRFLNSTVLIPR